MNWSKSSARRWLETVGSDLVKDACGLEAEGRILQLVAHAVPFEEAFRDVLSIVLNWDDKDIERAVYEARNGTGPAALKEPR